MAYKTWKQAYEGIHLSEAKYTNIHNKIKGIRNLSRKDAEMIANIDPAVLGPVVKALAPMFEDVNEADTGTSLKVSDTSSTAFNKLKTIAADIGVEISREEDHLLVQGDAKKMEEFKAQMSVAMKEAAETIAEKPYDSKDVYRVQQLEKKLRNVLKDVDKTMRGSGLSAPAFSMVRGGIVKGLDQIQKFYKIANK